MSVDRFLAGFEPACTWYIELDGGRVFSQADVSASVVRVGALRGSDSKRFYLRHGFVLVEEGEFDNYCERPSAAAQGWR